MYSRHGLAKPCSQVFLSASSDAPDLGVLDEVVGSLDPCYVIQSFIAAMSFVFAEGLGLRSSVSGPNGGCIA